MLLDLSFRLLNYLTILAIARISFFQRSLYMKKLLSFIIASAALSQIASAAYYAYKGTDSDLSNPDNYYILSDINSNDVYSMALYLYSSDYAGDNAAMRANCPEPNGGIAGKYSQATTAPSATDIIYFHGYRFATVEGETVTWGKETSLSYPINIKESITNGGMLIRGGSPSFLLGSADSSSSTFAINTGTLKVGYVGANFYIAEGAAQQRFEINVSGDVALRGGNPFNFGQSGAALDALTAKTFTVEGKMNAYVGRIETSGDFKMTTNATLSMFLDDSIFNCTGEDALIKVGGTFSKNENTQLYFDFNNVGYEEGIYGTFNIISADSLSGFNTSDSSNDISSATLDSISAIFGEDAFLQWSGNNLQLVVVPEPSAFAALLGLFAMAFAFRRKIK